MAKRSIVVESDCFFTRVLNPSHFNENIGECLIKRTDRVSTPGRFFRRTDIVIFAILCCLMIWLSPVSADAGNPLQIRPIITAGSEYDYPPFCLVDKKGKPDGFSVELLEAAVHIMGRDVTFQAGVWAEIKDLLARGKIDVLPLVGRTPEREQIFDFTFPYLSLHGAIVVRDDDRRIKGIGDLKGRRVAVMKGDNAEEFLRRTHPEIDLHTTDTFVDALKQLSNGRHDAVLISRLVAIRLIRESGLGNLRIIEKQIPGFRQDFCFAVHEGDKDTLALLNEGLAIVTADGTYSHLHAKWFAALELPAHHRLIIGGDFKYPPFEFLDENGRPAGYNVDIVRAVAREAGLEIEIRLGPWSEIIAALDRGEIDAIQGMLYSPERDLVYDFTQPYMVNNYISVIRKKEGVPPSTVEGLSGMDIVVQRGDIMHNFADKYGLAGQITPVETQEDALRELVAGKYDCALVSRLTAVYLIEKNGWKNLVLGQKPILSPEYGFAVPNNRKALLAQLSEGLKIIEETGQYRSIYNKWIGIYDSSKPPFTTIAVYIAIVAVPLLVCLRHFSSGPGPFAGNYPGGYPICGKAKAACAKSSTSFPSGSGLPIKTANCSGATRPAFGSGAQNTNRA